MEGFVPLNGASFYYRVEGPPGAPLLVFCHSLFLSGDQFEPQVADFKDRFQCLVWDQRGHGRTMSTGKFDFWDSARDLIGLMDALGFDVADSIFGASQGGMVAMRAAILAPQRFKSMVILGSSADEEDPETAQVFGQMRDLWVSEGMDGIVQKIKFFAFGDAAAAPSDQITKMEGIIQSTPVPYVGGLDVVQSVIGRDSVLGQLNQIENIPTLVLHGEKDVAYPVEKAQEIFDANKSEKSKIVVVPGAPHFLNITNPEAIVNPIEKFLADVGLTQEEAGLDDSEMGYTLDTAAFNMQINAPASMSPLANPATNFPAPPSLSPSNPYGTSSSFLQ